MWFIVTTKRIAKKVSNFFIRYTNRVDDFWFFECYIQFNNTFIVHFFYQKRLVVFKKLLINYGGSQSNFNFQFKSIC